MRVRKITNGGKKVIGKFPSSKMGKMVWWESQVERDYLYLLEFDPDVISYEEQPLKISYCLDGKAHLYTPDLRVVRHGKKQIVEVKDDKNAHKEEWARLFQTVAPICQREGYEYTVVTDRDIRVQPRLDNLKLIYKYAKAVVTTEHQILLYGLFDNRELLPLEEIIRGFLSKRATANTVYALIQKGILSVDLSQPIKPDSAVLLSLALPAYRREIA